MCFPSKLIPHHITFQSPLNYRLAHSQSRALITNQCEFVPFKLVTGSHDFLFTKMVKWTKMLVFGRIYSFYWYQESRGFNE